jgi:AraC-like DNA-binding protein
MICLTSNNISYGIAVPRYPVNLFVDHFVVMEGRGGNEERIYPNKKAEIFFNLGDPVTGILNNTTRVSHLKESVISGIRHNYFNFIPGPYLFMAGIRFTLFGFYHLFKIPANLFADYNFDTKEVWGNEMELVRERLLESVGYEGLINVLESWVRGKLTDSALQEVTQWARVEQRIGQIEVPIATLLSQAIGYSHKHSIQLVREKGGINPKVIQKINRFELVLKMMAKQDPVDWMGLVCKAGYADQSHLIREFRQFTGSTPTEYLLVKPRTFLKYQHFHQINEPLGVR